MLFLDNFVEKLTDWFMDFFLDPAYATNARFSRAGLHTVAVNDAVTGLSSDNYETKMKKAPVKPVFAIIFLRQRLTGLMDTALQVISDAYHYMRGLSVCKVWGTAPADHLSGYYIKINRGNLKWLTSLNITG